MVPYLNQPGEPLMVFRRTICFKGIVDLEVYGIRPCIWVRVMSTLVIDTPYCRMAPPWSNW